MGRVMLCLGMQSVDTKNHRACKPQRAPGAYLVENVLLLFGSQKRTGRRIKEKMALTCCQCCWVCALVLELL